MKQFPKIKRIGDSVNDGILESHDEHLHVQEKLDGANFRFTLQRNIEPEYHDDDRDLVFGSRNVVYKNEKDVDDSFEHAIEYVRENINLTYLRKFDNNYGPVTIFGEAMHPHTLDYDWDNTPSFIGFDAYSEFHGEFLSPEIVYGKLEFMNLPAAPAHTLDEVMGQDGFEIPDSEYYDGTAEGVVIKNQESGQRAKIRSESFKEAHSGNHSSEDEEYQPDDAQMLANKFATEARILKQIHKVENSGTVVNMEIMEDLWEDVFEDIIEEEYENIFLSNYTIDTQQFRSNVANQTANVLQTYLNRPNDPVLNEAEA